MATIDDIDFSCNYYKILGIDSNATSEVIKSAYLSLAKKYHPDRNKTVGAEEKFKEIRLAYEILNDTKLREYYDNGNYYDSNVDYTKNDYQDDNGDYIPEDVYFHYYPAVDGSGYYIFNCKEIDIDHLVNFLNNFKIICQWLNEFVWTYDSSAFQIFCSKNNNNFIVNDWIKDKYVIYLQLQSSSKEYTLKEYEFSEALKEILLNILCGLKHYYEANNIDPESVTFITPYDVNQVYWLGTNEDNSTFNYYKNYDTKTKVTNNIDLQYSLGEELLNIRYQYKGDYRQAWKYSKLSVIKYFQEHKEDLSLNKSHLPFFLYYCLNEIMNYVQNAYVINTHNLSNYIVQVNKQKRASGESLMSKGGWIGTLIGILLVLTVILVSIFVRL